MSSTHGGYSYASWEPAARIASLKAAEVFWFQCIQSFLLQECHNSSVSPLASLKQINPLPETTHQEKAEPGQPVSSSPSTRYSCALAFPRSGPEVHLPLHPLAAFSWCRWGIRCPGAAMPLFWWSNVWSLLLTADPGAFESNSMNSSGSWSGCRRFSACLFIASSAGWGEEQSYGGFCGLGAWQLLRASLPVNRRCRFPCASVAEMVSVPFTGVSLACRSQLLPAGT